MRKIHHLSIRNVNLISAFISTCLGALLILHSLNVSAAEYLDGIAAVVEDDIILVLGEQRRRFLCDRLHLFVGNGRVEAEEDLGDLVEKIAAVLYGEDSILECRMLGAVRDRVDLRLVLDYPFLHGGHVMLFLYLGKGRDPEGCIPFRVERILFLRRACEQQQDDQ